MPVIPTSTTSVMAERPSTSDVTRTLISQLRSARPSPWPRSWMALATTVSGWPSITSSAKALNAFPTPSLWHCTSRTERKTSRLIAASISLRCGIRCGWRRTSLPLTSSPAAPPLRDQEANRALFEEQVDIIFKAFNNERFSHKGRYYTLPPEVPYRGYTLKDLTLVPRPFNLPVKRWQPIQGGSMRALEFMAKHGIQGMVGGGSAEGGAMHRVVLDWQTAHAKLGKPIELGERLCFGFHFYMADSREQGMKEAAKYY